MTRPAIGDPREPTGTCRYRACGEQIHAYRLFCWPHWRRIPVTLRDRLARLQTQRFHAVDAGAIPEESRGLLDQAIRAIDAQYAAARVPAPRETP
jgi:hypothetical protein